MRARKASRRRRRAVVRYSPHFQKEAAFIRSGQRPGFFQVAEITLSLRDGNVRQGVAMLEELHNEFPSVPQHKYRLACACERLGAMLRRDPAQQRDAEQYLRRAVQLLTELTRDFPDTPDYHSHLAAALDSLMALPRSIIQLDEARRLIDVAIERQTAAVQANPAHRQYREYLAAHFGNLAAVLEQLGEHDGVDRAYVQRSELLRELANEDARRYEHELRTSMTTISNAVS